MLSCVRGNENESSRSGGVFLTFSMSSNPRAGARVVLLRAGAGGMGKDMGQGGDRPSFDRERPRLTLHPPDVPTHLQNTFSHVLLFYFLVKEILPPFILPSQTILGLCSAPNLHWTGINWFYPSCVNTWDAVLPSSPCSACWACNRQIQAKFHFIFFFIFQNERRHLCHILLFMSAAFCRLEPVVVANTEPLQLMNFWVWFLIFFFLTGMTHLIA